MIEINLIPDVKLELIRTQRVRGRVISASILTTFIALGAVAVLLIYIYAVQGVRTAYLDSQIKEKGASLAQVEDLSKVLTIQNQLASITEFNGQKNMSSRVFDVVAAITPTGNNAVSFSRIVVGPTLSEAGVDTDASQGGTIQLEGQTSGFDSMEVFKKTIENTLVQYTQDGEVETIPLTSLVNAGEISYGEDAEGKKVLRFNLSFDYPAELFASSSSSLSYKRNVNGNVTDSYLGIPRFTERAKDLEGEQ